MPGRILVIDPVSASRIVLRFRLESNYYSVLATSSVEAGLQQSRDFKPDLILLGDGCAQVDIDELLTQFCWQPQTQHVPVLVLIAEASATRRVALLRAGAEDVLDPAAQEDLLMARLRGLMRRRAMADEALQRDTTQRELALAEPFVPFANAGRVALVAANPCRGHAWQAALAPKIRDRLEVLPISSALAHSDESSVPDVFVIAMGPEARDPGIRLLSELRSRRETRHAATIAVLDADLKDAPARWDRAAMALDFGAAEVAFQGFDDSELALRIKRQVALKKQADHLRNSVKNGLRMAVCDPLTGLYNRRYALPHLARIATAARERSTPFATMLLDLDRFKQVNDRYGHAAGDAVLVAVADRLRDNLRSHDLLARIGGEEFLIAMPDTDEIAAREAADRLRDIIRRFPVSLPRLSQSVHVTCSIGVTVTKAPCGPYPAVDHDVASLIDDADSALYRSKATGRDTTSFAKSAA